MPTRLETLFRDNKKLVCDMADRFKRLDSLWKLGLYEPLYIYTVKITKKGVDYTKRPELEKQGNLFVQRDNKYRGEYFYLVEHLSKSNSCWAPVTAEEQKHVLDWILEEVEEC